jgi:hypothetical protein
MTGRGIMDIQEAIAAKKEQIDRLNKEIAALEVAAKILKGQPTDGGKPKSQPEMVAAILEEIGKPLHVALITEQLKKKYGISTKPSNLGVLLYRYSQRGKRFYKVKGKPNTYGLARWQSEGERAEAFRDSATLKAAS